MDYRGILLGYGNGSFANQINLTSAHLKCLLGFGSFADPKKFVMGYQAFPFSVVADDFNSDKKLDFAVANYGTNDLRIFLHIC